MKGYTKAKMKLIRKLARINAALRRKPKAKK